MATKTLILTLEASSEAILNEMTEALARAACDVSNSTEDDEYLDGEGAHISVRDATDEEVGMLLMGAP